ncbi:Type IV pilus biogenesis/stability protein PilW [Candidatus Nitrotoga sp. HW29]|uniref:type IV pilus biogenesis/stability protein PilW n=1 Tax=Candidatus Nitrotoga sp. HW29 TaxID=2886963 RepID=UPI001EF1E85A|nr:type IV pilus biogenesis/stability protein PilW [Candidatus Nitrotoga sp. HW29]CAH1904181.1 Type IV pilus biogenesis/stability protein PilW [Candidatus Nitrotoga sp. HW29]
MKLFSHMRGLGLFLLALSMTGCGTPQHNISREEANAKIHTELAAQYYDRGQLGVALEEVSLALRFKSDYAPAYNVRGLVRMALHEDQQADEDFQHSLRLDSTDSDTHNNYGWFLCKRGKEPDSIKHFMAALKNPLYSTPGKAYLNAGLCSMNTGNMKSAEEFLEKALMVQPNMPEALLGLANLYFAKADYAGAKSYFMIFKKNNVSPLTAENLWLAVRIERKLGDRIAENNYAMQLRKNFPDARETQLMLYKQ